MLSGCPLLCFKIMYLAKLCSIPVKRSPILDMHHYNITSVCCHILPDAAAYYKQCAFIPYCHLCTHWHYFPGKLFHCIVWLHFFSQSSSELELFNYNPTSSCCIAGLCFVQIHIYWTRIFYSPSIVTNSFSGPQGYCNLCHAFVDTGYQQQQLEQYVLYQPAFSAATNHPDRIMHPHLGSIGRSICACHFLTYCPDFPT